MEPDVSFDHFLHEPQSYGADRYSRVLLETFRDASTCPRIRRTRFNNFLLSLIVWAIRPL